MDPDPSCPSSGPETVHAGLKPERLWEVGRVLAEARNSAQRAKNEALGDTAWSTGCVAYDRGRQAVIDLQEQAPWLKVRNAGMQFLFTLGGVPMRFYHSAEFHPPERYVHASMEEEQFLQGQLGFMDGIDDARWRVRVKTDARGIADRIYLVRLAGRKKVLGYWPIWKRDEGTAGQGLPESRPLAPPSVSHDSQEMRRERRTGTEHGAQG